MSILNQFSMQDQVAIVTGAGKGIGQAIAIAFAEAGADVVCAARTEADLLATKASIEALGRRAHIVICDVNKEPDLNKLVDETLSQFGKINTLVNNAGGAYPNEVLKTSSETFDADYHFNVTTAFNLSRLCIPHLNDNDHANIINITSAIARFASPGFSSYSTVKAALVQLTRSMSADLAPKIRVNSIAPGSIMTTALGQFLDADTRQKMCDLTPMACLGDVVDIAAGAVYLASPAAKWVTGKNLEIDGGTESSNWPF